jgi:hypothetical protein
MSQTECLLLRVKEKAFSKGLPIHFAIDGVLMAEYPDGRIEVVKKGFEMHSQQ